MRNPSASVSDPNSFVTNKGEKFKKVFSPVVLPDGNIRLEQSDQIDIQSRLNAQRELTDMAYILRRLGLGDHSVLDVKNPMYGDFTSVPSTMAEVMQLAIDAERSFNSLPSDVRAKFGYDYHKWFVTAGSPEWLSSMGMDTPSVPDSPVVEISDSPVVKLTDSDFVKKEVISRES